MTLQGDDRRGNGSADICRGARCRTREPGGQSLFQLRKEIEALEAFYAQHGVPLEKYARPHLLRVVTGLRRELAGVKRRLLDLEETL